MRVFFVDDQGGSLASLAAGVAALEGFPGASEVHARSVGSPAVSPVVVAALDEIGLVLPPPVRTFSTNEIAPSDRVIAIGPQALGGVERHWEATLPPGDAPALVQRAGTRIVRDGLARRLRQG
ncbi:MAG: hypothetical protein EOO75_16535 [Myxococcales bacterium]|nr:MAG: hypothetical protein EOO75_16535 [Myxococcales bacterium]